MDEYINEVRRLLGTIAAPETQEERAAREKQLKAWAEERRQKEGTFSKPHSGVFSTGASPETPPAAQWVEGKAEATIAWLHGGHARPSWILAGILEEIRKAISRGVLELRVNRGGADIGMRLIQFIPAKKIEQSDISLLGLYGGDNIRIYIGGTSPHMQGLADLIKECMEDHEVDNGTSDIYDKYIGKVRGLLGVTAPPETAEEQAVLKAQFDKMKREGDERRAREAATTSLAPSTAEKPQVQIGGVDRQGTDLSSVLKTSLNETYETRNIAKMIYSLLHNRDDIKVEDKIEYTIKLEENKIGKGVFDAVREAVAKWNEASKNVKFEVIGFTSERMDFAVPPIVQVICKNKTTGKEIGYASRLGLREEKKDYLTFDAIMSMVNLAVLLATVPEDLTPADFQPGANRTLDFVKARYEALTGEKWDFPTTKDDFEKMMRGVIALPAIKAVLFEEQEKYYLSADTIARAA